MSWFCVWEVSVSMRRALGRPPVEGLRVSCRFEDVVDGDGDVDGV